MAEKRIDWQGDSYQAICAFPEAVRRDAGFQLGFVQRGLLPADWKPMSSIGSGVQEIRINTDGTFRIIYIAKYEEAIYVLHVFQKKSRRTAKKDIELARKRLNDIECKRKRL